MKKGARISQSAPCKRGNGKRKENECPNIWKLNLGVRTIKLTKIANYTCKLHTKETEYGAKHYSVLSKCTIANPVKS